MSRAIIQNVIPVHIGHVTNMAGGEEGYTVAKFAGIVVARHHGAMVSCLEMVVHRVLSTNGNACYVARWRTHVGTM